MFDILKTFIIHYHYILRYFPSYIVINRLSHDKNIDLLNEPQPKRKYYIRVYIWKSIEILIWWHVSKSFPFKCLCNTIFFCLKKNGWKIIHGRRRPSNFLSTIFFYKISSDRLRNLSFSNTFIELDKLL